MTANSSDQKNPQNTGKPIVYRRGEHWCSTCKSMSQFDGWCLQCGQTRDDDKGISDMGNIREIELALQILRATKEDARKRLAKRLTQPQKAKAFDQIHHIVNQYITELCVSGKMGPQSVKERHWAAVVDVILGPESCRIVKTLENV